MACRRRRELVGGARSSSGGEWSKFLRDWGLSGDVVAEVVQGGGVFEGDLGDRSGAAGCGWWRQALGIRGKRQRQEMDGRIWREGEGRRVLLPRRVVMQNGAWLRSWRARWRASAPQRPARALGSYYSPRQTYFANFILQPAHRHAQSHLSYYGTHIARLIRQPAHNGVESHLSSHKTHFAAFKKTNNLPAEPGFRSGSPSNGPEGERLDKTTSSPLRLL